MAQQMGRPQLNAVNNEVAIESLEITHEGISLAS